MVGVIKTLCSNPHLTFEFVGNLDVTEAVFVVAYIHFFLQR